MSQGSLYTNPFLSYFYSRSTWNICLSIFIINVGFKLINLTSQPIWYDECFSIFYSQGSIADTMTVSRWDINPPFYYLLLKYWMSLFGIGEFSVRSINVFFSSLAAVVLFLYTRRYAGNRAAWAASLIFLLSDILFRYSHEVRGYSWIMFCGLLSSYWFCRQIESPNYFRSFLLACSWYGLFMSNYITFWVLAVQALIALLYIRRISLKHFIVSILSFAILIYHWVDRLYEIITKGEHSAVNIVPTPDDLYHLILEFLNGEYTLYFWAGVAMLSIVLILIQFNEYLQRLQQYYTPMLVYSILLGILPIILAYYLSVKMPMFLPRYLLFSLIGLIPMLAVLFSQTLYKFWLYSIGVIFIIYFAFGYIQLNPSNHMNYRDAVVHVKSKEGAKRLIMVQTVDVLALFCYYYERPLFKDRMTMVDNLKKKDIYSGNDSTAFREIDFSKYDQVLLVQTYENFTDPFATVDSMLSRRYRKLYRKTDYEGVSISEYKK